MEKEIKIGYGIILADAVQTLIEARKRGKHVYCIFNGHKLHSDTVTMDKAYLEIVGCTKKELDQKEKERSKKFKKQEEERKKREKEYTRRVEEDRINNKRMITYDNVIEGLKFIAEHQDISQQELISGLLQLGCNFTIEDIQNQTPENVRLFEGMNKGSLSCGAVVIVNIRDSEYGRAYAEDRFLSVDDDTSIYHFIRVATGDASYTKENIDRMAAIKKNTHRKQ